MGMQRTGGNRNERSTKDATQWRNVPPDGGWGWVVAFGAAIIYMIAFGITVSGGIMMIGVMRDIFPSGRSEMAWMPIICNAIARILAPISTLLSRRFSHRAVVVTGGLLMTTGLGLCYQAQTTTQLLLIYGLIVGVGVSFVIFPTVILTTLYFDQHVSLANGLTTGGASVGCVCVPLLTEFLLQTYGVRITFMLLSAMTLHICAAAALFQPVAWHYKKVPIETEKLKNKEEHGVRKSSLSLKLSASPDEVERQLALSSVALTRFTFRQTSVHSIPVRSLVLSANKLALKSTNKQRQIANGAPSPTLPSATASSHNSNYSHPNPSSSHYIRQDSHASRTSDHHPSSQILNRKCPPVRPVPPLPESSVANDVLTCQDPEDHHLSLHIPDRGQGTSRQSSVVESVNYDRRDSRRASKISQTLLAGLQRASLPTSSPTDKIPAPRWTLAVDRAACHFENIENGELEPVEEDKIIKQDGPNFNFLKNPYFYLMSLTSSSIFFSLCSFPIMVPDFALEEVGEGVSFTQAAFLLSMAALADLASRSCLSWLWDLPCVNRQYCYMIFVLFGGLTFGSISFMHTYESVMACSVVNGLTTGISGVLIAVLFMQFLGTKNFGMGLTLASVLGGVLMLMSGSFIGVLKDQTGTYRVSFLIIGGFQAGSAIMWFLYELCCCSIKKYFWTYFYCFWFCCCFLCTKNCCLCLWAKK